MTVYFNFSRYALLDLVNDSSPTSKIFLAKISDSKAMATLEKKVAYVGHFLKVINLIRYR